MQQRGHRERLLRPEPGLLAPQRHGLVPHATRELRRGEDLVWPVVLGLGGHQTLRVLVQGGHQLAEAGALLK